MNDGKKIAVVIVVSIVIILTLAIYFEYYSKENIKTITAEEGFELAQTEAKDWSSDSKLLSISSYEGKKDISPGFEAASNDPKIGDGRTACWSYTFCSDTKDMRYLILIDAELNILRTSEENGSFSKLTDNNSYDLTISNWSIDSDTATKNALREDEAFSGYLSSHDTVYIDYFLVDWTFLTVYYSQPVLWQIIYGIDDEIVGTVFVDAIDGSVWQGEEIFWP